MSNITLKATTTAQTYVNGWKNTAVDALKRRSDKGQGAIEYVGITILVVAIVVALLQTNLGATISGKFKEKIDSVLNG
ncbi:hypothetical protein [Streptomyces sp. NBC_00338]|uniref:hypothetical protein n=1 Tax=unclassified Streptomyces TaxID=2593676 RepID=UPI00224FB8C4|nr:hypothetical protein [Streptomyces sp. NBC_00338]MCX5142541.1 hypothetical protein [Streptomyces sp. NBC_00338]WSU60996.1 hypothetical protein OG450_25535 [Streptomyces sp. NBC_01104]